MHLFFEKLMYVLHISKELVVTGGGIFLGCHFSPTKNIHEGRSRQNMYSTIMINNLLNRTGTLYAHFEYIMKMEPVIELVCGTLHIDYEIFFSSINQVVINHVAFSKTFP